MKSLAARITSLISRKDKTLLVSDTASIDFIRTRKGILKELGTSIDYGTIVGVYCREFGEGMFLTAVKEIEWEGKDAFVVFYPFDISGKRLSTSRLHADEIQMVCPFSKVYGNPMYYGQSAEKMPRAKQVLIL
jgi:hypothetical protein